MNDDRPRCWQPRPRWPLHGAARLARALAASRDRGEQPRQPSAGTARRHYKHIVVIYEENHSFDNLYGGWGKVGGQHGHRAARRPTRRTRRRSPRTARRTRASCRTTSTSTSRRRSARRPAAPTTVHASAGRHDDDLHRATSPTSRSTSTRTSRPTRHDLPADRTTCSASPTASSTARGLPGGCTRDLVHKFYQEQYQLNGGQQNRYVTGSDAVGHDDGLLRHHAAADLPATCTRKRRRTTSSPTTSSRPRSAGRTSTTSTSSRPAAAATAVPGRHARGPRRRRASRNATTRCYKPTDGRGRRQRDPGLRPADHGGRPRLRRLGRQHGAAAVPADRRVRRQDPADRRHHARPDHRRPADRRRRQLGLVLAAAGTTQPATSPAAATPTAPDRPAATRTRRRRPGRRRPTRATRTARTSRSSSTTSRSTTSRATRPGSPTGRAPQGREGLPVAGGRPATCRR